MITPTITPQEAFAAGCTASYSVDRVSAGQTYYKLSATPASGWEFDHFEWTQHVWDSYGTDRTYDGSSYSNPATDRSLCEYSIVEEEYDSYAEITLCVAVFKPGQTAITVIQEIDPEGSGSVNPTRTKHGAPGSSTTFDIAAFPARGFTFLKWVDADGVLVSKSPQATVTLTFAAQDQTFRYIAKMTQVTGEILHGSSGSILHGSGGTILFKG